MTQESKTSDVGGTVGVVLVHKASPSTVQPSHGVHATLISFAHVFLGDDQLDPVPALGLIQPLVSIDGNLSSQWLGQDQDVADDSAVGNDELVWLTDGGGHSSDGAPWVHDRLAAGDG